MKLLFHFYFDAEKSIKPTSFPVPTRHMYSIGPVLISIQYNILLTIMY